MPVLPGAPNRLDINPSSSVAQYRGGIAENAQHLVGEASARMGADIVQMADRRRSQLDELRVIEASTDLRKQELALTFDEKDGYQAVKGGDVIKRPIVQDYAARYKEATDKVTASLSPRQREMFAGHAASASSNFQANVMRHAMAETEKYSGEVYKADLISRYDTAGMSYKNAMVTNSQLEGIDAATHHRMDMQGINDPALRGEFVKAARGGLHATVIDKAITAGDTEFANEYFHGNKEKKIPAAKDDMTGDQRNTVERQLKPATDFALGKTIASDAFQKKVQNPEFNAAQYIADKAGSNPQAAAAAHSLYVQFVHEKKTAETEQLGSVFKQFYTTPTRATMNALVNTAEFRKMSDTQQATALHTMNSAVQSAEDRAENKIYRDENREYTRQMHDEAAARRAEQKLADSLPAVTKTNEIARSPNLVKMKPEEIYGLAPEIGIDNVKYLLGRQAQTNKELNNFNMDKQIVEGAKPPSAIKNKVQGKAIEEMAELEGQKFIQIHGVKPDRDQQVEIMRKVTSESISKPGLLWGTNEKKLYEMPPDQRNFYLGIQAAAEKAGRPPLTDEQLVNAWDLSKKQTPAKAVAPAPAPVKPVTAAPPDPLQDPAFKARQAALQKANQEFIAAANKKTEELKAQLVREEAKLAAMDNELNARVAGHGAALRKISESQKPELAAHKAMDAEIDAMPAKVKEEAIVSAYGTDDKVEVAKAEKAMDKKVEQIIKTPKNILTPSSKGGGTVLKPLSGSAPRNFAQPVEGSVSVVPSVTRGASAVNIAAKAGATVKAAAAGVVEFIGNLPRLGEVVIVKHPGDYMTVYGHNAEVGRKVGDQVRQGDQLGSATGGATLFEVRHKGVRVDPMKWLKKVGR